MRSRVDAAPASAVAPLWSAWSAPAVLAIVGLYLVLHLLLRLAFGGALGFDDAEQALFAQSFEPGYRLVQPPLYTWLLLGCFELFGVNLFAAILPRYLLLGVTFLAMYRVGWMWTRDRRGAALAVFAHALIYVFAYYAHHDLTHTTALGAGIALTFLAFAHIVERPASHLAYAGLGLAMAVGVLGKWNYVLLALGLPLACLLHPPFRRLVLTPRVLTTLAVLLALTVPTGLWILDQPGDPGGAMTTTLEDPDSGGRDIVGGTLALIGAALLFPMPFLAVALPLFGRSMLRGWRRWRAEPDPVAPVRPRFLALLIGVVLALHWLLVPLAGAGSFTARWMHPALMVLPVLVFQLAVRGDPDRRAVRAYLGLVALAVVLVVGARTVRHVLGADHCGRCREMAPFDELADALRQTGFERGTIVGDGYHIAGNLRMRFPDSRVLEPGSRRGVFPGPTGEGGCLAVWQSGIRASAAGAARVRQYLGAELSVPADAPMRYGEVTAPMHGSLSRTYTLGYGYLAQGAGDCR